MGVDQLTAKDDVQNLEEFQRKSAATETMFTLAVLYVSFLQVIPLSGWYRPLTVIPLLVMLAVVWLLGGDNLIGQIQAAV